MLYKPTHGLAFCIFPTSFPVFKLCSAFLLKTKIYYKFLKQIKFVLYIKILPFWSICVEYFPSGILIYRTALI